ncbi:WSC-domain-containing protein [Acephala macrosclerotiorum]|nr:WSC-domain-containing protein [Acephala macrosclerotiorum]
MRFTTSSSSAILAFSASAAAYSATARTFAVNHFYGKGPLMMGRVDPIVSPGGPSGHVHAIQGGNAFGVTMTDTQALDQSTCTSSLIKNDKSNYWTPSLWFQDPVTKELEPVDMFYMNVYYFFEATTDKITAFQPGHRMVVGSPSLRTPPASGGKSILDLADGTPQPVQFTCPRSSTASPLYPTNSDGLHGVGIQDPGNAGAGVGFPDQNCDGYASPLRADVHFPSCYNPAAGLDNYKENMQFPTNGNCPSGWIHTPHLFYEVYWNTPAFASRWTPGQGNQPFLLSNGDPTGYSLHGDFISGWDVDTLQQIIDNCDAGDSGMDKCPGLIGGLNDPSTSCNIADPINEVITGVMTALPGNNPVTGWGVNVGSGGSGTTASMAPSPTTSKVTSSQAASSQAPASSQKLTSANEVSTSSSSASFAAGVPVSTGAKNIQTPGSTSTAAAIAATPVKSYPTTLITQVATTSMGSGDSVVTSYVSETTVVWTTVTATGPAPTATGNSSVAAGWSYYGCYQDTRDRVLTGIKLANVGQGAVTNTNCVDYCSKRGFSMAGTEYGGQCFCGNELSGSSALSDTSCDMPCEGDETQTCGGGLALSVYSKSSSASYGRRSTRHMHRHLNREIST